MATINVNKVLPVLAVVAVLGTAVLVYQASKPKESFTTHASAKPVKDLETTEADADSVSDTLRSLTGRVEESQSAMQEVTEQALSEAKEKERILEEADEKILEMEKLMKAQQRAVEKDRIAMKREAESEMKKLRNQLSKMARDIETRDANTRRLINTQSNKIAQASNISDYIKDAEIPPGLGLGSIDAGEVVDGLVLSDIVWVSPIDRPNSTTQLSGKTGSRFCKRAISTA